MILFAFPVSALESATPVNIYYVDDNLYAYLKYNEEVSNYCNILAVSPCKTYIEYNWKTDSDTVWQKNELIEVDSTNMHNLILSNNDEYYLANNLKFDDLVIRARYIIYDDNYKYYDWSEEAKIRKFDFVTSPIPEIENFKVFFDSDVPTIDFNVKNKNDIESFFTEYMEIYNTVINYQTEFRVNDIAWKDSLDFANLDFNDIKLEIRYKYTIDDYTSKDSNILVYEVHPEVKSCLFNSDFCCYEILNISLCIWLLALFIIVVITLIVIENINRRKYEA